MIVVGTEESLCIHHDVSSHVRYSWPSWRWPPCRSLQRRMIRCYHGMMARLNAPLWTSCSASPRQVKDFVPEPKRLATFDNDGTLWAEQPIYFQLAFAFDRVKALAPQHPEWKDQEPFKSFLAGDLQGVHAGGAKALVQLVMVSHAGITTDEFEQSVKEWLATPRTLINS
jgi:hypothetical protein